MRALLLALPLLAGCVSLAPVDDANAATFDALWGGAEEIVLLEETVTIGAPFSAGADACLPRCGGEAITSGARLVPPGTNGIQVLAEWSGGPEVLRFVYDTGSSADAQRTTLARGEPLLLPIAPDMTDAPGQRHTHWWWGFFAMAEPAGAVPETNVSVRVTAHRGADEAAPPAGAPTGVLVPGVSRANRGVFAPGAAVCPGCEGTWWSSAPGGIIGPEATTVRATVAWTWAGEERPMLGAWPIGVDERVTFDLVEERPGVRVFEVAVDPAWRDDASQWKSLWWFFVQPERPGGVLEGEVTLLAEALAE